MSVGAARDPTRSMPRVRFSWRSSLALAAAGVGVGPSPPAPPAPTRAQTPNYRVTYHLRVVERAAADTAVLASAVVSGPPETDLRLSLRTDRTELDGLLGTLPDIDTVNVAGMFFARRAAGRSRRGDRKSTRLNSSHVEI